MPADPSRGSILHRLTAKAVLSGLVLTAGTMLFEGREYVHASVWDPSVPLHESTCVRVATWGRPVRFLRDRPFEGRTGAPEAGDRINGAALLFDTGFWISVSTVVLLIVRAAAGILRRRVREGRAAGPV